MRIPACFLFFGDFQPGQQIVDAHLHRLFAGTACPRRYVLLLCQHGVELQKIRVILVLPLHGCQGRWTVAWQARAARIESRVDKV